MDNVVECLCADRCDLVALQLQATSYLSIAVSCAQNTKSCQVFLFSEMEYKISPWSEEKIGIF